MDSWTGQDLTIVVVVVWTQVVDLYVQSTVQNKFIIIIKEQIKVT